MNDKLIKQTNAEIKTLPKGRVIIDEGEIPTSFHYLIEGELVVHNFTEDGKEFLQHKVTENHYFLEPAVLLQKAVPGTVEVFSTQAKIIKIKRENFLNYMRENPDDMLEFTKSMAHKALNRSKSLKSIVLQNPEERIINQLEDYKKERNLPKDKVFIDLTRKEISNMTGLRIETVIRTIKKMEKEGKLEIKSGKVYY